MSGSYLWHAEVDVIRSAFAGVRVSLRDISVTLSDHINACR